MKSIFKYITHNLAILSLFVGVGFFTSCEDENVNTGIVELHSFGPVGVKHGEMIQFVGVNLDQVTAVVFANDALVNSSEFKTRTSTKIEIIVPDNAEAGNVMLKTPKGDVVSKTIISFDVPVVINTITAEAKPGTNITISGEFINWIESVTFTSDLTVEKEDFISQSETQLVVKVPMEAQSGFLTFASGGTEPMTFNSADELIVTIPTVTSLSPESITHEANLTITGTDLDLITELIFNDGVSVFAEDFVSQSVTEIVVKVPVPTEKGTITLKQWSPIDVVTTQELTIKLPVASALAPTPAVPGIDNITITGTNLDLVGMLMLPGDITINAGSFISHSETEIVFALPEDANAGGIAYTTIHGYSKSLGVAITLPGPGPAPLIIVVYEDALEPTVGEGGGWNTTTDFASTENPRTGTNSVKVTFNGNWGGGGQFGTWGKPDLDVSATEVFIFSIFGGAGTDGAGLNVALNGNAAVEVVVNEGKWVDFEIPLANWGGPTAINEIWFQDRGFSGNIYIDHIGFGFPSGPALLPLVMYDDEMAPGGGDWSWNIGTSDAANTEQVYSGEVSWKFETPTDGGASSGGINPALDASPFTYFSFSLYGGPGTQGASVAAILNDEWNNYQSVTLVEGQWTEYQIELSNYPDVDLTQVVRWIFKVEGMTGSTIYIDRVGFE